MPQPPIKAGLLGLPLAGSLSPEIFRIFSGLSGREIEYRTRECGAEALAAAIRAAGDEGWAGFNVTIPYKTAVFKMLAAADQAAREIGAVNAARFGKKGLEGINTDSAGIIGALKENGVDPAGRPAVVFGSGGSARAAGWALARSGAASVTFCARNAETALEAAGALSAVFPKTFFMTAPFAVPAGPAEIFVNATPLGMYSPGMPPLKPKPADCCLDLAYAAGATEFIAAAAHAAAIDGLEVLVRQASLSLRYWAGLPAGDIVEFNREALTLLRKRLRG